MTWVYYFLAISAAAMGFAAMKEALTIETAVHVLICAAVITGITALVERLPRTSEGHRRHMISQAAKAGLTVPAIWRALWSAAALVTAGLLIYASCTDSSWLPPLSALAFLVSGGVAANQWYWWWDIRQEKKRLRIKADKGILMGEEGKTLDMLAKEQGAGPVEDIGKLAGDWPEDDLDEFVDEIRRSRT